MPLCVSCHIPPNRREGGNGHARLWSTRAQHRYGKRRPHRSLRTNTRTSFRTIWQRDPKILRVHFSTKKEARHTPPFLCRCPAFMPGTPCSSASSTPTDISDEQIPDLVEDKPLQALHLPVQSPSDEEADQEVTVICRAPEYYRVRLHVHCRHRYFMYNTLDDI